MKRVHGTKIGKWVDRAVWFFSGEWALEWSSYTANGGTVVFARSVWVTLWVYTFAFLLRTRFGYGRGSAWDPRQGAADLVETLPWLGAIFAGVYAALYTRFSSQWNYLAGLFNQIVQTQATMPTDDAQRLRVLASWKAAFIEDAEDLHLAAKPMFLIAVVQWGSDPAVADRFASNTVGGAVRLDDLLARLRAIQLRSESGLQADSLPPKN